MVIKPYRHRNGKENRREHNNTNKRQNNIEKPLCKKVNQVSVASLAAVNGYIHKLNGLSAADNCVGNFRLDIGHLALGNAIFYNLVAVIGRNAAKENRVRVFKNFKKLLKRGFFRIKRADNAEAPFKLSDALERDIGINIVENNNRPFCCVNLIINKVRKENPHDRKDRKGQEHHNERQNGNQLIAQKRKDDVACRLQKRYCDYLRKDEVGTGCRANLKAAVELDKGHIKEHYQSGHEIVTESEERRGYQRVEEPHPAVIHGSGIYGRYQYFKKIKHKLFFNIFFIVHCFLRFR